MRMRVFVLTLWCGVTLLLSADESLAYCSGVKPYRKDLAQLRSWAGETLFEISPFGFSAYENGVAIEQRKGRSLVEIYEYDSLGPILVDIQNWTVPRAAQRILRSALIEGGARFLVTRDAIVILLDDEKALRRAQCLGPDAIFVEKVEGRYEYRPPPNSRGRRSEIYSAELFNLLLEQPSEILSYSQDVLLSFDSTQKGSANQALAKSSAVLPGYKKTFVLKNSATGAIMSQVIFGREAYELSSGFEDFSDLHYQSEFRPSLPGQIIQVQPKLRFLAFSDLDKQSWSGRMNLSLPVNQNFSINFGADYRTDNTEIAQAFVGFRDFVTDRWLLDARVGKLSEFGWAASVTGVIFDLAKGAAVSQTIHFDPGNLCKSCYRLTNIGLYHGVLPSIFGQWNAGYEIRYRSDTTRFGMRAELGVNLDENIGFSIMARGVSDDSVELSTKLNMVFTKPGNHLGLQSTLIVNSPKPMYETETQIHELMTTVYAHSRSIVAKKWQSYMSF